MQSENERRSTLHKRGIAITDDFGILEELKSSPHDLKDLQFPRVFAAPYGRPSDSGINPATDIVSLVTNTMRKEAHDFFRLVETCTEFSVHMNHQTIDHLYQHLEVAVEISVRSIDALFNVIVPFAEMHSALKGNLRSGLREGLHKCAHEVAETMMASGAVFVRRRPAAEQMLAIVKAAIGFEFLIDIAALADRHLPLRLEKIGHQDLRACERAVFGYLMQIGDSPALDGPNPTEARARVVAWMNDSQLATFRRKLWNTFGSAARNVSSIPASESAQAIGVHIEEDVTADMISSLFDSSVEYLDLEDMYTGNV